MQLYKVRISLAARADMVELRKFLKAMMTEEEPSDLREWGREPAGLS